MQPDASVNLGKGIAMPSDRSVNPAVSEFAISSNHLEERFQRRSICKALSAGNLGVGGAGPEERPHPFGERI